MYPLRHEAAQAIAELEAGAFMEVGENPSSPKKLRPAARGLERAARLWVGCSMAATRRRAAQRGGSAARRRRHGGPASGMGAAGGSEGGRVEDASTTC